MCNYRLSKPILTILILSIILLIGCKTDEDVDNQCGGFEMSDLQNKWVLNKKEFFDNTGNLRSTEIFAPNNCLHLMIIMQDKIFFYEPLTCNSGTCYTESSYAYEFVSPSTLIFGNNHLNIIKCEDTISITKKVINGNNGLQAIVEHYIQYYGQIPSAGDKCN